MFSRDEGVTALVESTPTDDSVDIEESVTEVLEDCSEDAADHYLDILLQNGYLYAVGDDLHITPE